MELIGQTVENRATHLPVVEVLGMVVTEINRASAARSGMEMAAGLIVKMVRCGGVADRAGVTNGDIIAEVDGNPVQTIRDLHRALAAHADYEPLRFLFRRVGATRFMALPCQGGLLGEFARFDACPTFGRFIC